jgi:hypothetical protein
VLKLKIAVMLAITTSVIFADYRQDYSQYLKSFSIHQGTWEPVKQSGNQVEIQGKADVLILLHTLFPTVEGAKRVGANTAQYQETIEKAEALKRFLIMMKVAKLHLVTAAQQNLNKNSVGVVWPYALASAFGHGQRILVTLNGVKSEELLSFLLGQTNGKYPDFVKKRAVSSHGVRQLADGSLEEIKMSSILGATTNLFKGALGKHLYINYSWGGIGQIGPDGMLNGVSGKRYNPATGKVDDGTKLGHLYIFHENLDKGVSAVLFGVETCSPGSENPYGVSHGIQSGMHDLKKNRPVNGGTKMQGLFGPDFAPAEYGGMRITVDKNIMQNVAQEWNKYNKLTSEQQFEYMRNLLVRSGDGLAPYIPVVVAANH